MKKYKTLKEIKDKYFPNMSLDDLCNCAECKKKRRKWLPKKKEAE